ncbi:MAG TPA: SUF system NifU family Fe-S cluster assembly protein [Vicinamibacterales bacterium]
MSDLRDLYQEVILDHHKRPRNFREMPDASTQASGHNPLCGDRVTVFVRLAGDRLEDVSFQGSGCAISKASASIMTDAVKGRRRDEVDALFHAFQSVVTGEAASAPPGVELDKLEVFAGVRDYPSRVKCATLAWHALNAALKHSGETVSTE